AASQATQINLDNTGVTYELQNSELRYANAVLDTLPTRRSSDLKANETLTTLAYNTANNELTYTGENGTPVVLNLNEGSVAYNAETNVVHFTIQVAATPPMKLNTTDLKYEQATSILSYEDTLGVT